MPVASPQTLIRECGRNQPQAQNVREAGGFLTNCAILALSNKEARCG